MIRACTILFWLTTCITAVNGADESIGFYIGTGTDETDGGVFLSELNPQTGVIATPELAAPANRCTFLALHPTKPILYGVAETYANDPVDSVGIVAWKMDPATKSLTKLNHQPAGGDGPCFVTVSDDGRFAALANYGSGSITVYPLDGDGVIQPMTSNIWHRGSSIDAGRQGEAHAHSVRFDSQGKRLLAADLGTDKVYLYDVSDDGKLTPSSTPTFDLPPGSGPRHFVFSRDGRFVFVLNEMKGTISTFDYEHLIAAPLYTTTTMADDIRDDAARSSAEILLHPTLPVIYCSNRGPSEIATLDVDENTGKVTRRGAIASGGLTPRNFNLTPDGGWLIVANQDSGSLAVLSIDPTTGELSDTAIRASVPSPMCIKFIRP